MMLLTLNLLSVILQIKQKRPAARPAAGKRAKKGALWKFTLDLTHPVEDGILDSANFVSLTASCGTFHPIEMFKKQNKMHIALLILRPGPFL